MRGLILAIPALFMACTLSAQCLSSVTPVGGTSNLLVLQKNTLHCIGFYRHAYADEYFEGDRESSFDIIRSASYHYIGTIVAYGLFNKLTLEAETGYYPDKTQIYETNQASRLTSSGFSDFIFSFKIPLFTDFQKRLYISFNAGVKIPSTRDPLYQEGVKLPVELQPSTNAYGMLIKGFFVKEQSLWGLRFFLTHRIEINSVNPDGFKRGNTYLTSAYLSKHIMSNKIKGDWTVIMQLRNEIRNYNLRNGERVTSSGSNLFFITPQINTTIFEKINLSVMTDIPIYQYFNGTQLAFKTGVTFSLSTNFSLFK